MLWNTKPKNQKWTGETIAAARKAHPNTSLPEAIRRMALRSTDDVAKSVHRAQKRDDEKMAIDLQFDSQEQAQRHQKHRAIGAGVGTLAGSALGGMIAGKRFGVPGAVIGGGLGAIVGGAPGRLAADIAHDIPQRTRSMYNHSMERMNAAGGEGVRVAAAMPSVTDFLEFAEQDHTGVPVEPGTTALQQDMLDRLKPAGFGAGAGLEGGDDATRNEPMGLPQYGGV